MTELSESQWRQIEAVLWEMLGTKIGLDGKTDVGVALSEIKAIVLEDKVLLRDIWKNPDKYQFKWEEVPNEKLQG